MPAIVRLEEVKAYLSTQPALLIVFMVLLLDTFGSGSHNLGMPLLAERIDASRQALYYGMIWAVWGAGNVLTTYVMPKFAWIGDNLFRVYFWSTPFMSLGFIVIFMTSDLPLVLGAAFATGAFDAFAMTSAATLLQQSDNRIRGRVFGVSAFLNRLGFGVGFIVAPLALERLSLFHMVTLLHGFVIAGAILGILMYRAPAKTAASRDSNKFF